MGELDYKASWAPKNWCFWTVVLERTPWPARRSNQSIVKEISFESSLEGLMLKLKLQYFGHLMQRADSFKKSLMLGKLREGGEGDNRGWDGWMASLTQWTGVWVDSGNWWWTGRPGMLRFMRPQSRTQLSYWTEQKWTCLLRNLYAGQEAIVRTGRGKTDGFKIKKEVRQGCILSPCLINFYAEYIMRNARLEHAQAGMKIARRHINNLRYADDTILMGKSEEEWKSLLIMLKRKVKKLAWNSTFKKQISWILVPSLHIK